jgi:hypothetical protein
VHQDECPYNNYAGGLASAADFLAAIKRAVHEEDWLTLRELREALADNVQTYAHAAARRERANPPEADR